MFELTGKVAIITGAAAGLGQAIAVAFAKQGAKVVAADLPDVFLKETGEMLKQINEQDYLLHDLDVTDKASIDGLIRDVKERFGRIDILASNAGINRQMPFEEVSEETWDAIINVNLKGSFFMTQAVADVMKEQESGRIIFTSSQAGIVARSGNEPYSASKGGIIAMTRSLAYDLAPYGVTVNTVAPCFARTKLSEKRLADPDFYKMVIDMIPLGRVVEPEEVGATFSFLASDEAAMITGQTIVVDGGWTMW